MMKETFNKLFIGFLLVFIDFNIIIVDVLPDPLGYFFIYQGLQLHAKDPLVIKSRRIALCLIFLSIPTMFIHQQTNGNFIEFNSFINGWTIYENAIALIKLVLVYYVFKIMIQISISHNNLLLTNKTKKTCKVYVPVILIIFFLQPFFMNISSNISQILNLFMIVTFLILEIYFLILLSKFKQIKEHPSDIIRE